METYSNANNNSPEYIPVNHNAYADSNNLESIDIPNNIIPSQYESQPNLPTDLDIDDIELSQT